MACGLGRRSQDRIEGRSWSASELLVTSRAKSQDTLLAKLRRRPYLQLNTIQDIAGVRIDADLLLGEQTRLAREIADHFGADQPAIHDLRDHPHAGYRAVHVWLRLPAGRVEIQIRTILQSLWANFYELLADAYGRGIRYDERPEQLAAGVVPAQLQELVGVMQDASADLAMHEAEWQHCAEIEYPGQRAMALGEASKNKATVLATTKFRLERAINEAESAGGGG